MNIKSVVAALATTALLASSTVSCSYDDTEIWNEIDQIKQELVDLRTQVENELNALNSLVSGMTTVTDVSQKSDGSTVVTLSDGSKITVYPKGTDVPANTITTVEIEGVLYWAYFDGLGTAQPILVNGKNVPVADVAPQTKVNDETGAIEVSFDGGKSWITTGYTESDVCSLFADVDVVYSDWQVDADGNPVALYCVITLHDGTAIKVGMQHGHLILPMDSVFVAYGGEATIYVDVEDAADYMTQVPRGWACDVKHEAKNDRMILTFKAPTYEQVQAGYADIEGVAKLMVVFNNGSSAIASVKVSTNAVTVNFTHEGVYVEASYGTDYILCGIIPSSSYKASTLTNYCNDILAKGDAAGANAQKYVRQVAFMDEKTIFTPYEELREEAMVVGTEYTFWYVVPRDGATSESSMYVVENEMVSYKYTHSVITLELVESGIFDATVKFGAEGSLGYMLGYELAEEFDAAELAAYYTEHPELLYFDNKHTAYEGSFLELFDPYAQSLNPGTKYVAWCINKPATQSLVEDNVVYVEFETSPFADGGTIEVVASDENIEYTRLSMNLSTVEGHVAIYYNILPSHMASAYPDDTYRKEMLLSEGKNVISDKPVPVFYDKAKAGDKLTLFAMAVDKEGKFGKILVKEYTTKNYEYNALALTLTLEEYKVDDTKISVACEGASKFLYVYAPIASTDWTDVFGGSKKKAGEFIIANPTDRRIYDTSVPEYALVDGKIQLSGLTMDEEYAVVVMAIDAENGYSEPQACYFTPIANIGVMVKRTDANWAVGKPEIIMGETTEVEFFNFSWYTKPQKGYVAYSMVDHPENLVSDYFGTNINTPEKLISYIVAGCDNGKRDCGHRCEWQEDNTYTRTWREMADLNGDGRFDLDEWVEYSEEGLPGVYNSFFYGTKDEHLIYVTWVGEDGNFHEPFAWDPTNDVEVELTW